MRYYKAELFYAVNIILRTKQIPHITQRVSKRDLLLYIGTHNLWKEVEELLSIIKEAKTSKISNLLDKKSLFILPFDDKLDKAIGHKWKEYYDKLKYKEKFSLINNIKKKGKEEKIYTKIRVFINGDEDYLIDRICPYCKEIGDQCLCDDYFEYN